MESIGAFLKQRREELGIALEEVAQNTKINKKYLEAIEGDRLEDLPENVYQKIFVTAYAKQLGIPEHELEKRIVNIEETSEWRYDRTRTRKSSKRLDLIFVAGGVVLGAIVLLLLILKPDKQKPGDYEESALRAMQGLPLKPVEDSSVLLAGTDSLYLRIEAQGRAEVSVVCGSDTLYQGNLERGDIRSLAGWQNLQIQVDKPGQVRLYINGQLINRRWTEKSGGTWLEISQNNLKELTQESSKN
jgi:transcriptional regulator with XRE-family HTH domain